MVVKVGVEVVVLEVVGREVVVEVKGGEVVVKVVVEVVVLEVVGRELMGWEVKV